MGYPVNTMTGETKYLRCLGQRVRQLRKKEGWSQEEFAHRSGLHRTYISSVEQGQRNVAALNLRRMAKALGVSLSDLLRGID
jgi:transcriptional regulator with XRE-family HTH domain